MTNTTLREFEKGNELANRELTSKRCLYNSPMQPSMAIWGWVELENQNNLRKLWVHK